MDFDQKELVTLILGSFIAQIASLVFMAFNSRSKELKENTLAIVKLSTQMDHAFKYIDQIPKIRGDIDSAHRKIREICNER